MNFNDSRIPCLHGLTVTPYQAYFHPQQPIYSPQYVQMQLYIPIEEERGEGGIVSNNVLYYQSEKFELDGSQKPQFFPLDNVLFMGGEIRFVFSNFLQRQTLEEIVGENYDDYYMCIAHASVHCTFVNDFQVASVWKLNVTLTLPVASSTRLELL